MLVDISIIIPIFNSWEKIEKIIKKIYKKENFLNIEIILVDDCSKVVPMQKIDIIKKIRNVKIFFLKKNKGPGIARNFGTKKASGKFIWFIDSDDLPSENWANSFEKFKKKKIEVDFVTFPAEIKTLDKNKKYVRDYFKGNFNKKNSFNNLLGKNFDLNSFNNCIWQYWFNRAFLLKKKIFFDYGNNYEDVNFLSKVFNETKYCTKIKDVCYYHIRQNASITAKKSLVPSVANIKFSHDILETIFSLINLINFSKNKNMDKFFLNRLNRYILDFVSYLFIINDFKNNFKNCEISLKKKILLLSKKKIKIQNQKFKNIINLLLKMSAQKLIDYYFSEKNLPTALKKRKGKFVVHCYSLYSISWVKLLINKNPQFFGFIDSFEYGFKDKLYGKMILNSISSIKSSIDYIVIINRQKKITKKITKHYVKAGFKRSNIYEISYT